MSQPCHLCSQNVHNSITQCICCEWNVQTYQGILSNKVQDLTEMFAHARVFIKSNKAKGLLSSTKSKGAAGHVKMARITGMSEEEVYI